LDEKKRKRLSDKWWGKTLGGWSPLKFGGGRGEKLGLKAAGGKKLTGP